MAKSQYEYVKQFELSDVCMPHTWIMCRIDGIGFTKFTAAHHLQKPNDARARHLMNTAAKAVMNEYTDICIAYGVSDEYSFILHPGTELYSRRTSKITSAIVSIFTSAYVANWNTYFPESPLQLSNLPFFDSRLVCYPTDSIMKDYLRWRQVDCHINNLYNTCFWKLVHRYQSSETMWTERQARDKAHEVMHEKYASSSEKNDLLHDEFGMNYNDESEADKKGSILVWKEVNTNEDAIIAQSSSATATPASATTTATAASSSSTNTESSSASPPTEQRPAGAPRPKRSIVVLHCDLIQESFYTDDCPGIIPYQSWSIIKKLKKAEEKAMKKAVHKEREKKEKEKEKMTKQTTTSIAQTNAIPETEVEKPE